MNEKCEIPAIKIYVHVHQGNCSCCFSFHIQPIWIVLFYLILSIWMANANRKTDPRILLQLHLSFFRHFSTNWIPREAVPEKNLNYAWMMCIDGTNRNVNAKILLFNLKKYIYLNYFIFEKLLLGICLKWGAWIYHREVESFWEKKNLPSETRIFPMFAKNATPYWYLFLLCVRYNLAG